MIMTMVEADQLEVKIVHNRKVSWNESKKVN